MKSALAAHCLVAVLALSSPNLSAADAPRPGRVDPRIRSVFYNPEQVVLLTGYLGYQMMIEFAPGERLENVSIGDSLGWQVTPNHKADLLFLKPVGLAPPTNMTVVTDLHRYAFELRSRRAGSARAAQIAYIVRFEYPEVLAPVQVEVTPPPPKPPQQSNIRYTYTGSRALLPSQVFDDGAFTYFKWPEATSAPALFLVDKDGAESIVNYGMRDGYQVVEQVAQRFILRSGKDVTYVINDSWREPAPGALAPRPHDAQTAKAARHAGVFP